MLSASLVFQFSSLIESAALLRKENPLNKMIFAFLLECHVTANGGKREMKEGEKKS